MNALEKDAAEGKRELAAIAAAVERDIGAMDFILLTTICYGCMELCIECVDGV